MRLSKQQKQAIVNYFCLRPEVAGVYLYGSQTVGGGRLSDVDLAVLLKPEIKAKYFSLQLEYIGAVQNIVKEDLAADVKILDNEQALIYQASVISKGELIVNNQPETVKKFVNKVGLLYPDFYPVLHHYFSKMNGRLREGNYAAQ